MRLGRARRWLPALFTTLVVLAAAPAGAQTASELKAAFLLSFVKFTEWPPDAPAPGAPLVLCTTDEDVASALLGASGGREVDHRTLIVRRVKLDEPLRGCAVLHVGEIDRKQTARLATALQGASVLSVGDAEDFASSGGVIGLFVDGDRMRFAINPGAAERMRLRLSARLLNLAKIVKG